MAWCYFTCQIRSEGYKQSWWEFPQRIHQHLRPNPSFPFFLLFAFILLFTILMVNDLKLPKPEEEKEKNTRTHKHTFNVGLILPSQVCLWIHFFASQVECKRDAPYLKEKTLNYYWKITQKSHVRHVLSALRCCALCKCSYYFV